MIRYLQRKIRLMFETDPDIREAVDADELLWKVFQANKIEEASTEVRFDGEEVNSNFEIAIVPKSKTAILYEPVLNNNLLALGKSHYYPSPDVQGLISIVAHDAVWNNLEPKWDDEVDLRSIFIVTFRTKNKRISVDVLGP